MKFTRNQIWRHNGFLGSVRMAYLAMITIQTHATTSQESRRLAYEAEQVLSKLAKSLKKRVDQE